MKTEVKLATLSVAFALTAGAAAQAAEITAQPAAINLLKTLRNKPAASHLVASSVSEGSYVGFTDRIYTGMTDRVYTGMTDR